MTDKLVKILTLVSKIALHVFAVIFGIVMVAAIIMEDNSAAISALLGQRPYRIEDADDDGEETPVYFDTDKNSVAEMKDYTGKLVREVTAGGVALLKNENNTLPMKAGTTISFFSVSSVDMVYVGSGSSSIDISSAVDIRKGVIEAGLKVNEELWKWYSDNKKTYSRGEAGNVFGLTFPIKDASWSQIGTTAKSDKSKTDGGVAVFVLARNGGEGADLISYGGPADYSNGNYLELNANEIDVLKNLKQQKDAGVFSGIVVLINSAYAIQCDFADNPSYGIDSVMWVGNFGETGAYAVGDILAGKINPSGAITDTFWKYNRLNPVMANFGTYDYNEKISPSSVALGNTDKYVVYQEGIYNGYRYTETRYEDYVLGRENAGTFDYYGTVSYPFGYGISYTQFEYSNFEVKYDEVEDLYTATVKVTNTGDRAGREIVQIYLQKPYTQYDINNDIEKAAVELVGFGKTGLLDEDDSETVTVEIEGELLASYDAYKAQTYILDAGDYYFTAARDAHDAINNILEVKATDDEKARMTSHGDSALVYSRKLSFNDKKYSLSPTTGKAVTNQFDNADLNIYEGAGSNSVQYITRNNWEGTVKLATDENNRPLNNYVKVTANAQIKEDVELPTISTDTTPYPTYGAPALYTLVDLRHDEIAYDDEMWEDLLDQLTWEDTVSLLSVGVRKTAAIATVVKPETIDHNGANGPNRNYNVNGEINQGFAVQKDDPDKSSLPVIYPCNALVASTFDTELIERFGDAMGEDCLWAGYSGLYGTGINIHRSAYGGRAFEYYSEDPVLTGLIAAAEVRGIQSNGVYCYMKHCVLNDMENNREGLCVWANEQTIREVYLRAFEIAIEQGGAYNVMTGFNRIGTEWTGEQGFVNNVLRDEFGMRGFAVTDWYDERTWYMTSYGGILGGNDLPDGQYLNGSVNDLNIYKQGYGSLAWAMRESAHRILYTVAHSSAMNGYKSGTKIIPVTPKWIKQLNAVRTLSIVFFSVSVAFFASMIAVNFVIKKSKK